ncbi:hypothetical protein BJL95_03100 [Methylomonas sp. LWB]|nr:hypothetical protein BJL95_03100 [Methylomonas sp. LWB]
MQTWMGTVFVPTWHKKAGNTGAYSKLFDQPARFLLNNQPKNGSWRVLRAVRAEQRRSMDGSQYTHQTGE